MLHLIGRILRRWRRDEAGNVVVIFGASAIPLLLIMGGAVDIARYTRYKAELSNAVDAASLALARDSREYDDECETIGEDCDDASVFVTNFVNSFDVGDTGLTVNEITATRAEKGFVVTAEGTMDTIFLPFGNMSGIGEQIRAMDVNITAQVVQESNRLEVALVLDNTGSMNCVDTVSTCALNWASPSADSRIVALKAAAVSLVDTLMAPSLDNPDHIKIAVVPFEGMVNVSSAIPDVRNPPNWVDWSNQARAKYTGRNIEPKNCNGTNGTNLLGHKCLFDKLYNDSPTTQSFPGVKWAGCVEMRAGTYELSDAAPDTAIADSLFVPFFWPDEPDDDTAYWNNYLKDIVGGGLSTHQRSFTKYSSNANIQYQGTNNARRDVEGLLTPYEWGPNKGCPRPIVPLTTATAAGMDMLEARINGMIAYWATGTFIPAGLVWGWHVLSSGVPYSQGTASTDEYYDQTVKAIVLLTDGENEVTGGGLYGNSFGNDNLSAYSAYNFVKLTVGGQYRLGSTLPAAITALNTKTSTLCENVKTAGIRVYTVTFGGSANQTLMTSCASAGDDGQKLHYHAPTPESLAGVFDQIGEDLQKIHLSM